MNNKARFHQQYPDKLFLENDKEHLSKYLKEQNWIKDTEQINLVEKPGEGNMNFVIRVKTNVQSFILKQARPWVEKYPQIEAPIERVAVEARYFMTVEENETLKKYSPALKGFDKANGILALEDLGQGADYSRLYQKGEEIEEEELRILLNYLSVLHQMPIRNDFPENRSMKELNHEHIFNFPFLEDNGFNLDDVEPGLQEAAMSYKKNTTLKKKISDLGDLYLAPGTSLLHGDYYPGSWLKVEDGLKVIDPEFGFIGLPEFEIGVLMAHMYLSDQSETLRQMILLEYKKPERFSEERLAGFTGTEILRRLIGIAQLPLSLSLDEKKSLMQKASEMIQLGRF